MTQKQNLYKTWQNRKAFADAGPLLNDRVQHSTNWKLYYLTSPLPSWLFWLPQTYKEEHLSPYSTPSPVPVLRALFSTFLSSASARGLPHILVLCPHPLPASWMGSRVKALGKAMGAGASFCGQRCQICCKWAKSFVTQPSEWRNYSVHGK